MNNLEMNLPSGKPPDQKPKEPKIQRIEIAANGGTTLNGATVTATELKTKLTDLKASDPDLSVVVKGADEVDYQHMVVVLDVLQQLDITKVGLATQ
jgi:biopolymer transport protein ExbD